MLRAIDDRTNVGQLGEKVIWNSCSVDAELVDGELSNGTNIESLFLIDETPIKIGPQIIYKLDCFCTTV